ncbi:MAG: hypothetical protein KGN78_04520 [Actinomycetales bacterium]|nr:hypothetical protein [Actinomycetales bacterium]
MDERGRLRFSFVLQLFAVVMFTAAGLVRGFAIGFDSLALVLLGAGAIACGLAAFTYAHLRRT